MSTAQAQETAPGGSEDGHGMGGTNGRPHPGPSGAEPGQPADGWPAWLADARPSGYDQVPQAIPSPGADRWPAGAYIPDASQVDPAHFLDAIDESRTTPEIAGAPAAALPQLGGRFDAEWSPRGAWLRRNSLLRRRGRAGGGAMVRKATLDRGLRPDELAADEFGELPARPARPRGEQWRGGGGRWLLWVLRAVLWTVVVIVGFRGVISIVDSIRPPGSGSPGSGSAGNGFPTTLAEAFAMQFGEVYLNFSPGSAAQRAADLTPFIPVGSDPQFGWNGSGTQQLQSEQVAAVSVSSAHQATVTLLARVNTGLVELGVPVYYAQGGLVISAEPALLAAPDRASPPPATRTASDSAAAPALNAQLQGFFQAYASGDQQALAKFLAPGTAVTGLGGAVTFGSVTAIEVPSGGATRRIAVSVAWQLPAPPAAQPSAPPVTRPPDRRTRQSTSGNSASTDTPSPTPSASPTPPGLQATYEMTVVRQHGAWFVQAIGPSSQQPEGS
jgi:Conjugative transposon protein TcpC